MLIRLSESKTYIAITSVMSAVSLAVNLAMPAVQAIEGGDSKPDLKPAITQNSTIVNQFFDAIQTSDRTYRITNAPEWKHPRMMIHTAQGEPSTKSASAWLSRAWAAAPWVAPVPVSLETSGSRERQVVRELRQRIGRELLIPPLQDDRRWIFGGLTASRVLGARWTSTKTRCCWQVV